MSSSSNTKSAPSLLDYIRSGTTISLNEHADRQSPMLHSRSSQLLGSRGPTYPCLALDLSRDLADENVMRRQIHSRIMETNPNAFRRKVVPDSPTSNLGQEIFMKDLLGTMHPYKDPSDINKSKRFTYSAKSREDQRHRRELEERQYNELKPISDFLHPEDLPIVDRKTGYEPGHVRSLFHLDVVGPQTSVESMTIRQKTPLPLPNSDRYAVLNRMHGTSRGGHRPDSPNSASSRPSTAQSQESMGKSTRQELSIAASMESVLHLYQEKMKSEPKKLHPVLIKKKKSTENVLSTPKGVNTMTSSADNSLMRIGTGQYKLIPLPDGEINVANSLDTKTTFYPSRSLNQTSTPPQELVIPASLRRNRFTPGEERITTQDRQLLDPNVRRQTWYKSFVDRQQNASNKKVLKQKVSEYLKNQQELAQVERRRVRAFEQHLQLAKFEA